MKNLLFPFLTRLYLSHIQRTIVMLLLTHVGSPSAASSAKIERATFSESWEISTGGSARPASLRPTHCLSK
jgi:hypothetical protein